jgi:hypothetical protein
VLEDPTFNMMAKNTMEHRTTFLTNSFNARWFLTSASAWFYATWSVWSPEHTLCPDRLLEPHLANSPHHVTIWRIHPVAGYISDDIWRHPCHIQHYASFHHSANWAYTQASGLVVHKLGLCSHFLIFVFQQSVL